MKTWDPNNPFSFVLLQCHVKKREILKEIGVIHTLAPPIPTQSAFVQKTAKGRKQKKHKTNEYTTFLIDDLKLSKKVLEQ